MSSESAQAPYSIKPTLALTKYRQVRSGESTKAGTLVSRDADGRVLDATPLLPLDGIVKESKAAGKYVTVLYNHIVRFSLPGIIRGDIGSTAYVADNNTLTLATSAAIAGTIIDVNEGEEMVFVHLTLGLAPTDVQNIVDTFNVKVTSINEVKGTFTGGVAEARIQDGLSFVINETSGAPGFDVDFTFVDMSESFNILSFIGFYTGNHNIIFQVWNDVLAQWDDITAASDDLPITNHPINLAFIIPNTLADYYNASSEIKIRMYHATPGNVNHFTYLDSIQMRKAT